MRLLFIILFILSSKLMFCYETIVESNEARYDGELITLTGNVSVENEMGKVTAEKALLKKDSNKTTKIDFPWIELKQNVQLKLSTQGTLRCDNVFLDHTQMTSLFSGKVHYSDDFGEIYAEKARVDYSEEDGSLKATKIVLCDNVRLINTGTPDKPTSQYALADEVYYYPEQQLAILEGKQNRVLFFDQQKNIQISAKTVHAKRNPDSKNDSIEGKGDVRFVLGIEEIAKLKTRFQIP